MTTNDTEEDAIHVDDVLNAADDAVLLVDMGSPQKLDSDRWYRRWARQVVLEAGEASGRLMRAGFHRNHHEKYPELTQLLYDAREGRHSVAHEYDSTDHDYLWAVMTHELPALAAALQRFRDDPANAHMFDAARVGLGDPPPSDLRSLSSED